MQTGRKAKEQMFRLLWQISMQESMPKGRKGKEIMSELWWQRSLQRTLLECWKTKGTML
jgi:hypothetical protein